MAVSARLGPKTERALARYCKIHGLTKTQALERGIALLTQREGATASHPAYAAFERLFARLELTSAPTHQPDSIDTLKRHLDEKYPG